MRIRSLALALALVLALVPALVPALALPVALPGLAQTVTDAAEIQALLDRRAGAVAARDRAGFLDTIDPGAGEFREAQAGWFDRIGAVPVTDYSLRVDLDEAPELTRERDRAGYGVPVIVAVAEERFHVEGFDEFPALNTLYLTFVRREAGWLIASDSDLSDLGFNSTRHPWDFGTVVVRTSPHFMMLVHPEDAAFAEGLLDLAEDALGDLDRVWKAEWNRRVVVLLPATRSELEDILDTTIDVSNFVAFATVSVDRVDGWAPAASRIILNRQNFVRFGTAGQRAIFAHELLHVATRPYSGPFVSLFVEEGLAQMAEPRSATSVAILNRAIRAGTFTGKLPENLEFLGGSGQDISLSYQKAFSAMSYLSDRYGSEKVEEFYRNYGAVRIEPGTSRYHLDRALEEVFGLSFEQFEAEWAEAARRQAR